MTAPAIGKGRIMRTKSIGCSALTVALVLVASVGNAEALMLGATTQPSGSTANPCSGSGMTRRPRTIRAPLT